MILILGSHQDDVLYCASLLNQRQDDMVLERFPCAKGTLFNQEAMVVHGVHSSVLSSAVVTEVLSHHYVSLVFVVGKCFGLNQSFKQGDIVIADTIIDIDVDLIDAANVTLSQIPGIPREYRVQQDVMGYLRDGFHKRTLATAKTATLLCSDNLSSPAISRAMERRSVLGSNGPFIIDSCTYGVALSCFLHDVPCVAVKAVERDISEARDIKDYLSALNTYVDIGKAVVYTIGDVSRNDILRLRRGQ